MVQIGDLVQKTATFAQPGVVTEKESDGTVVIDTSKSAIEKYHRYIDTTGLSEPEKINFNRILDDIFETTDREEILQDLQDQIDTLSRDATKHNLVSYLKKQQAILIRQTGETPRFYNLTNSK